MWIRTPTVLEFIGTQRTPQGFYVPSDPKGKCPNCGRTLSLTELNHSSSSRVECDHGVYHSTLFGVCKECAKNHSDE